MLCPLNNEDYTYEEKHYGYILSMMKKFDLCYTPDDVNILIPSAFEKEPKLEYSDFKGEGVRTYILQFKDYMPLALIHRFIAKNIPATYENNYWYSGIVITDKKSDSLTMVQADKEAKRIYVRIKGSSPLGMWEHIRREFDSIASSYAHISYSEQVSLDDKSESTVEYEDLISHLQVLKNTYFHPKLKMDFNVGYLIGLFQTKEDTIDKIKKGEIILQNTQGNNDQIVIPPNVFKIVNNLSQTVSNQINTEINIDIDIQIVNQVSSEVKGDADYLLEEIGDKNKNLSDALKKIMQFAEDSKSAKNSGDVKEKGWGKKLKSVLNILKESKDYIKGIQDGGESLKTIWNGINNLAHQFNLHEIVEYIKHAGGLFN